MYRGIFLVSIVLLVSSLGPVQALSLTQTINFSTSDSVSSGANGSSFTDSLFDSSSYGFSQFDPALGILKSIGISVTGDADFFARGVYRDTDFGQETKGRQELFSSRWQYLMPSFSTYTRFLPGQLDTCSDGLNLGGAQCSTSIGFINASLNSSQGTSAASILASYIGLGTLSVVFSQYGTLSTRETDGDDGFVESRSANLSASGQLRLTYEYDLPPVNPVPVPAAIWLFGAGIIGLFGFSKRRKSSP